MTTIVTRCRRRILRHWYFSEEPIKKRNLDPTRTDKIRNKRYETPQSKEYGETKDLLNLLTFFPLICRGSSVDGKCFIILKFRGNTPLVNTVFFFLTDCIIFSRRHSFTHHVVFLRVIYTKLFSHFSFLQQ